MAVKLNTLQPNPPDAFDNSMLSKAQRCPRKYFYQYVLDRAHKGQNYPIQFGIHYHAFRELLERFYLQTVKNGEHRLADVKNQLFQLAWNKSIEGFDDPPVEDRKSYLHTERLKESCEEAFQIWLDEKATGRVEVLFPEQPFELELPNGELYIGRMDQIILYNDDVWVRDFKTTSRMGRTYKQNFDPNNQMTGYVWAAQKLSGRDVEGVFIETLYNTKTKGPQFHNFLSTRTQTQIEEWIEETMYEIEQARQFEEDGMWPKRTVACNDYGGCNFRDACSMSHWRSRERWLLKRTIESTWDPREPDLEAAEAVID